MTLNFKTAIFLGAFFSLLLSLAAAEEKIRFHRPVLKGEVYRCEVRTEFTECVEVSSQTKRQPPQLNYLKIELNGNLEIIKTSESTYPALAELTINSLLISNGKDVSSKLLPGDVISIDLQGKTPSFTLKQPAKGTLGDDEKYALSVIFTNPKNKTLTDMLGKEQILSDGEKWPLSKTPFLAEFRKNGFTVAPEDLLTEAQLLKKTKILDLDCWEILLRAEVRNMENLKFSYTSTLLLPTNETFSGTVIYSRETASSAKKPLPDSNPMSAGLTMSIKTTEKTYSASVKTK